ncbi:hypothetical protein P153DRAFT_313837 [Dothidotthia symphoricarpi CBS 119687]|uniref:C3H1-type domain-containing protein n=1 Tax=Dothidotthia symphoricarpi CBS 119687 TaxID=1392245 RepID=A0A6A6AGP3_9PLEO|nr:uncharacterized protein P153DRAFT_313837 [Dothidotthia symphoricarpi CBS 119687]KAF2130218.1 hypothetical protein P153DRAFT_313837 [Dothidotthia symphoricarpi CBS 119687]
MLADGKIDSLDTRLEQFKLNNQSTQSNLQNLLRDHGQLLSDYKSLRAAFEEQGSRGAVKHSSITAHNSYVLMLVDGNGYICNDELIREKEEGGMRAARMLNDAVEKYLQQSVPEARTSRIVVRIYADLTNLSKQLAKSKVTGLEKRSIAPFSAAFTRAISLFDFVDALDEEGTKFKIREQFKFASEDKACSHILYAACHDNAYLSQLAPFSGARSKITLVQGAGFISEFHQFKLNITQFPTIFRWSELPTAAVPVTSTPAPDRSASPKELAAPRSATSYVPLHLRKTQGSWRDRAADAESSSPGFDESSSVKTDGFGDDYGSGYQEKSNASKKAKVPCRYFQKGFCQNGSKCGFQHDPTTLNSSKQQHTIHRDEITTDRSNVSGMLPVVTAAGYIALNKDGQRLDTVIRSPTQDEWVVYNSRFRQQKPCNNFHLQQDCTVPNCPYDHNDLEPEARHVLEYVLKCNPCPRKSNCRASDCYYGHICQKDGCTGQMKGCKMKANLHNIDPNLESMVPAENEPLQVSSVQASEDIPAFMW